jgi:glycosyltransferase involved in cell wall biosynthesis
VVDHVDPIEQFSKTHPRLLAMIVRLGENVAFTLANTTLFVYDQERSRVERWSSDTIGTNLGVEYERFANPSSRSLKAAHTILDERDLADDIAIYVGGLEPIYNIRTLLEAARLLEGWTLLIIGTGSLIEEVRKADRGSDSVCFVGTVPHETVPGLLAASDVGVSLVDDAHTLKVLEYGASRLPVVQLDGAARGRFQESMEYCTADPDQVADAIRRAKARETATLGKMSKGFDMSEIAESYMEAIDSVGS